MADETKGQTDAANLKKAGETVDKSGENDAAASKAAQQQSHSTSGDPAAEKSAAEADAAAARTRQAQLDAEQADQRRPAGGVASTRPATDPRLATNLETAGRPGERQERPNAAPHFVPNSADPRSRESRLAQHEQVDRENERRNEQNSEGFAKLMERDQRAHEKRAEQDEERVPPTGKQRDLNTPTILPDGTTVWR